MRNILELKGISDMPFMLCRNQRKCSVTLRRSPNVQTSLKYINSEGDSVLIHSLDKRYSGRYIFNLRDSLEQVNGFHTLPINGEVIFLVTVQSTGVAWRYASCFSETTELYRLIEYDADTDTFIAEKDKVQYSFHLSPVLQSSKIYLMGYTGNLYNFLQVDIKVLNNYIVDWVVSYV